MNNEIYIIPRGNRYFLIRGDKKQVGSKWGYKSRESASRARWFLTQGKEAMKASYKGRMWQEMKHLKSI